MDFKFGTVMVHIFPPEIYEHWETYAARDPYFGMLTKKSENGTVRKKHGQMQKKLCIVLSWQVYTVWSCKDGIGMILN